MFHIYNSFSKTKEIFSPINPLFVGVYLCGPTVYGEAHIGHARSAVCVDILVRYLKYLGYTVRYVRNITDVGHLERDSDDGEDKIFKQAHAEKLEPMEIAQRCSNSYRDVMKKMNVIDPSIEPLASGHIIEQIQMIQNIIDKGYAYEINGSVYFNLQKFIQENNIYGQLSGKKIEELIPNSRELNQQDEKRFFADFALWKRASESHIMKWASPWGDGFPGWHIECSAMSKKYLGSQFDFHAGGMDLKFPHHECEIAQSSIANGAIMAKYWFHNNMVTIDEQKMSKSLGNFIGLYDLFEGKSKNLQKKHSPMALRFFILQAHYRSPLSFSEKALDDSYEAYKKIMRGARMLFGLNIEQFSDNDTENFYADHFKTFRKNIEEAINEDLSTPNVIAALFEILKIINKINDNKAECMSISKVDFLNLRKMYVDYVFNILGLIDESPSKSHEDYLNIISDYYQFAKAAKNYELVDTIRQKMLKLGLSILDKKDGIEIV